MLERPESDLHFVRPRDPVPTVEVDLDCIPEEMHGYSDFIAASVTPIAAKSPTMTSTIYVYQGLSSNFGKQTWSAFFGVAGHDKLLEELLAAFRRAKVTNARFSESIDPSTATKDFHVQDGHVWRPLESGVWYTESPDDCDLAEDAVAETGDSDSTDPETNEATSRISSPLRFRAARADATVGAIRKAIEEVFGLPEGSVALCGPEKSALRGNATIATLRKRWE